MHTIRSTEMSEAKEPTLYGIIAEFDDSDVLMAAAKKTTAEGYTKTDAYVPYPVHGLDDALGVKRTILPWIVLAAALGGGLGGFYLQYWISVEAYPLNVGGRPMFSWPSFMPITFECTILAAGVTTLVAMLALNGLPLPYHPIFNAPNFERASRDGFFLCIEADDEKFDAEATRTFMETLGAKAVSEVNA